MNRELTVLEPSDHPQKCATLLARCASFEYDVLPPEVAAFVRQAADQVRQAEQTAVRAMFDVGRVLLCVKAKLTHGQFGHWLKTEANLNEQMAQPCMRAVIVFGDKSDTVSVLTDAAIYELSKKSTPTSVRNDIVASLERGERPTTRAVLEQVKAARVVATATCTSGFAGPQSVQRTSASANAETLPDADIVTGQGGGASAAQRAGDLILAQVEDHSGVLVLLLDEADADEFRQYLQEGFAAKFSGGSRWRTSSS